jgi:inhibitor of KinA sporulation pathway (predicted exonuclease)
MKSQNYFSLDLELNKSQDDTPNRIIEVGIAIGNPTEPYDNIKTFNWYLDPGEPISPFIEKLTGISDTMIETSSVPHEIVANELGDLLKVYEIHTSPVVWGGGGWGNDATELKDEFTERGIDFPFFGHRVIDVKTIFTFNQIIKQRTSKSGLRKAMLSYGLDFVGTPHRASIDALNTLRFFFHLLERQKTFEDFGETMRKMK